MATAGATSYDEVREQHRWEVPERYNIARDVCFKHPPDKLAMIHEDPQGNVREVRWGELQELANRFAKVLATQGVDQGDRVAMLLPPTPETAAAFLATWHSGAILLSMSVLYGDEGIRHRVDDSQATLVVTNEANAHRVDRRCEQCSLLDDDASAGAAPAFEGVDTLADDPAQLYYTSRHDRPGQGHHPRAPLPARPRGVRLLPRGRRRRALPRHGRVGVGGGHRAADRAVALRGDTVSSSSARAASTRTASSTALAPRGDQRLRDADGDPVDDVDRRRGHALPAEVPARVQRRRAAEPGGDPLVPRAVRDHRARLLRAQRELPARGELPVHGRPRGLDGQADARLGRQILDEDEKPVPQGERGEICLRARSNPHWPLGYWNNEEATEETFGGEWFHTKDAARFDEDGYVWYEGRADDVIISAGYRIGPFEVESACLEHPAVAEAAAVASPDERRGMIVKAFVVLAEGHEPSDELGKEISTFVRERHSAYAYPRVVEFIDELPKTLTGKIRRIELRQRDSGS